MAEKYELFIGKNKQGRDKKYLVFDYNMPYSKVFAYGKRFFRCSGLHLYVDDGYIWDDGLYLSNPAIPGAKLVTIACYRSCTFGPFKP